MIALVDDDRHDDAVLGDGIRKLSERAFVEALSRLIGIGEDLFDLHLHYAPVRRGGRLFLEKKALTVILFGLGKQGGKPFP